MSRLTIDFYSNALCRPVQFKMIVPNDFDDRWPPEQKRKGKRMKTIFLLHGYTGGAENFVPENLMSLYNFAVVMPNGENGFWIDGISTGHKFGTFLTEELVGYVRKTFGLAMTPDETYVMGFSMGGLGALRASLANPDVFGKAVALSPALIIHSIAHMKQDDPGEMANYEYYRECFGDLETVEKSRHNPEVLIEKLVAEGKKIPDLYIAIGLSDFLLDRNRDFHKWLSDHAIPHKYFESAGGHDPHFWDEWTKKIVPTLFED